MNTQQGFRARKAFPRIRKCRSGWLWILGILMVLTGPMAYAHSGEVIASCDVVGVTGDLADWRGLKFVVDQSFASVEVRMAGSYAGIYDLTAELRRSTGFDGPVEAAARVHATVAATSSGTPYSVVHIDFPEVSASGSTTFTLRFVDVVGPGTLYFETAGIGWYPCPAFLVTETNTDSVPTLRGGATGMRVLAAPASCLDCAGDLNGDRVVNLDDLAILSQNWLRECPPKSLPILIVTGTGFSQAFADSLASLFGIKANIRKADGSIRFTDPTRFLQVPLINRGEGKSGEDKLPTVVQSFNFKGITGVVPDDKSALSKIQLSLAKAGLNFSPAITPAVSVDHAMFNAVDTSGRQVVNAPLDTQINYEFMVGDIPLLGPGVKMKFSLDGAGQVSHITMALPTVEVGAHFQLLPVADAQFKAQAAYAAQGINLGPNAELTSKLVYYAPPTSFTGLQIIQPHWAVGGRIKDPKGGSDILLRVILIPAIDPAGSLGLLPHPVLYAGLKGGLVTAGVEVGGGTPPYTYAWNSSTTNLSQMTSSSVQYAINIRKGLPTPSQETLTVVVTDSSGISVTAGKTIPLPLLLAAPLGLQDPLPPPPTSGIIDVGTEWVGKSMGLNGSSQNAGGFALTFILNGVNVAFNWGDYNAWEQDFKDPVFAGGDDTNWADNVDAVFYTGHANGDGFSFPGAMTDGFLHYDDARWGQNDLEWITVAACGPLQFTSGGRDWWQRWGPAFHGLHLINGYQTITFDNTREGSLYAELLLAGWTVRQAWMQTAIDVQPATYETGKKIYMGVMGVFGPNDQTNWDDHFHARGTVTPDIPSSQITGFWMLYSPT